MKTIVNKVVNILYDHQWGRDFLLTLFQALRFFWGNHYNASRNPQHDPPIDWYVDFYNAGNLNWEIMDSFTDEQKAILEYFCRQTAKKFDFYDSDEIDFDEIEAIASHGNKND